MPVEISELLDMGTTRFLGLELWEDPGTFHSILWLLILRRGMKEPRSCSTIVTLLVAVFPRSWREREKNVPVAQQEIMKMGTE